MAFPSPPSQSSLLIFLLLLASAAGLATNSQESENMMQSLRNYGYSLFTNGIATSDLKYQLLNDSAAAPTSNFTVFAPRDELLYALDMATDAAVYVGTLRYHVVPNCRHTFADLKNLSVPFLDTLLPDYAVLIGKFRDVDFASDRPTIALVVDGVRVSFPDLFVGSRIAVHGIDGILLTGLNMSGDLDDNDRIPPAGSPAPGVDASIRPGNGPSTFRSSVSPAPASGFSPVGTLTPPHSQVDPAAPASGFDGNISAEGTLTHHSQVDPAAPANHSATQSSSNRNIPAEGTPISPSPKRDRNYPLNPREKGSITNNPKPPAGPVPGVLTNPAATTPKDHTRKVQKLRGKRPGKSHRKGHRRHRRRWAIGDL